MELILLIFISLCSLGAIIYVIKTLAKPVVTKDDSAELLENISLLKQEKARLEERNTNLQAELEKHQLEIIAIRELDNQKTKRLAKAEEAFLNQKGKIEFQQQEMEKLNAKFKLEFENIASKILKDNTLSFEENNKKRLGEILNPLHDKIKDFEKKIGDSFEKGIADRNSLKGEIKQLIELNQKLGKEANDLTKALKGDSKKQGNWGEIILERILEQSGLTKGQEYDTQSTTENQQGDRIRPDVIVNLPENKHIIIDSKVSLTDYEKLVNATEDTDSAIHLKAHIQSIKNHINGLSKKNYHTGVGINTPDFVLLFMPIESAFSIALQAENELFTYAWDKKIVIVSPTTLLATLRTISSIWKQEKQTKNALEIAEQSGRLYDKFVGFLDDLEKIEKGISTTKIAYEGAINKLKYGSGNLIGRIEKIKKLGAKANKQIPEKYGVENKLEETNA